MTRLLLIAFLLLIPRITYSAEILNMRTGQYPDKSRIVFEMTGELDFQAKTMQNPNRLIINLPVKNWNIQNGETRLTAPFTSIAHEKNLNNHTQISIPLSTPHIIQSAFMLEGNTGKNNRLVIDMTPSTQIKFVQQLSTTHGPLVILKKDDAKSLESLIASFGEYETPIPKSKPITRKKPIIMIDAGHGGKDPGAISPSGIQEKMITLPMAKRLAQILNQSGKYVAKLTRSTDRYIKLYNRVKIARNADADLFISIHADSVGNHKTHGASIYTLSNTASDTQTAKLAARENQADLIGGIDLNIEDKDVSAILIDLSMRETMNQSKKLANSVVQRFKTAGVKTLKGPHRYAGFAVLKAPDVPSILIETGFVSNEREAKRLLSSAHQTRIANTILKSLDHYFGL